MTMETSNTVVHGLAAYYGAYNSHDPERFASALATGGGVSIIGTGPGEGRDERGAWIASYAKSIPVLGIRLQGGPQPSGYAEGNVGYAVDRPRFIFPDGRFVLTRLTAILRQENEGWKVVHLHFSVEVPDAEAFQGP